MELELHNAATDQKSDACGESRAFVLLESARLRCESLMARFGRRSHLVAIHREIGLAGYITCTDFSSEHRRHCLALAATRLAEIDTGRLAPPQVGPTLARMFSETICASDALAAELATHDVDETHRDRLHLVHAHVMSACELLDERLTVLELRGVGIEA